MMGYDTNPAFSPDGTRIAWLSMERDGYEADKCRLFVMDMKSGEKTDLTTQWDYTIEEFAWRPDGNALWFIAYHTGVAPVFSIDAKTGEVTELVRQKADFTSLAPVNNETVITMAHSMVYPNDIYSVTGNKATQITEVNKDILDQIEMPTVEERWVPTTDGKKMLTWVVYPPKFDKNKKYPAILYCQGGPQSAVSQFWSYRWNLAPWHLTATL
jgi:dipeptidyl aminopeptidase/acylaminoacyl peptidase